MFARETWDNQARIVTALGEIGDAQGAETVVAALAAEDASVRLAAHQALGGLRTERAARALRERMRAEGLSADEMLALTRAVAAVELTSEGDALRRWRGRSPELDREISLSLYELGDASEGEAVVSAYARAPRSLQTRMRNAWRRKPDARAVSVLIRTLRAGDVRERRESAAALESFGAATPVADLADILTDADEEVRLTVGRMLRRAPEAKAIEALVARLKANPAGERRTALVETLAAFRADATVPALLDARLDEQGRSIPAVAFALERFEVTPEKMNAQIADGALSAERRAEAAVRLGRLGEPEALSRLSAMLGSPDGETRRAAAESLGTLRDRGAVESLVAALDDADPKVRAAAAASLNRLGVTPARLAADVRAGNGHVQIEALRLLGKLGGPEDAPVVTATLRAPEPAARRAAAEALAVIGGEKSVESLVESLRDADAGVRGAAAVALGNIRSPRAVGGLLAVLRTSNDATLSAEAATALAKIRSSDAVPALIDALRGTNAAARAQVARALGDFGDVRAVPPLTTALEDASPVVRYYARQSLIRIGISAPEKLLELFSQPNRRGWFGSAEALRSAKPEAVFDALQAKLADPQPPIRALAASMLGSLRDERAVAPLTERLEAEERFPVRWWLLWALGRFPDAAREPLLKFARDKKPRLRADAMRGLGYVPLDPDVRAALRAGLKDEDVQVRSSAVESLGRVQDAQTLIPLFPTRVAARTTETFRPEEVIDALLMCGDAGRGALMRFAQTADAPLRARVLHRLGEDGNPDALPTLLSAVRDASPQVRAAAVEELARQSDDRVVPAISAAVADASVEVRLKAVALLARIGDPQVGETLRAQLERERVSDVRTAIEDALRRLATP
jgi:HEAT repeat protein